MIQIEQRLIDLANAINLYLRIEKHEHVNGNKFCEHNKIYPQTNEDLTDLPIPQNASTLNALTVLGSGDQAFNLIGLGIKHVDTFDINRLTEYYALGFKKVAIENLSYQEYVKLIDEEDIAIQKSVILCAPKIYKEFWENLFFALKQRGVKNPDIFKLCMINDFLTSEKYNNFLVNESAYKNLQKNLLSAQITFQQADITELPTKFKKYNLVYLSNILDYYIQFCKADTLGECLVKTHNLMRDIYNKNLKDDGEIMRTNLSGAYIDFFDEIDGVIQVNYDDEIYGARKGRCLWKK